MKYYEWLKGTKERNGAYEIITVANYKKGFKTITTKLSGKDLRFFLTNENLFKNVLDNSDGAIYEFMEFKKHFDKVTASKTKLR